LPLRLRCFGTGTDRAISHGGHGSFGNRGQRVLGDVGVRFGGSEHHRIETSSSHTRPPPFGVGTPGHRDKAHGALRSTERQVPRHRVAQPPRRASGSVPTRGEAHDALRSIARRSSPRPDKRRSSEHRASNLTEARQTALFGASGVEPHRDRDSGPLRRGGAPVPIRPASPPPRSGQGPDPTGYGRRRSSEHRALRLVGAGNPALFGARAPPLHRDRATGVLRSTGQPAPLERDSGPLRRDGAPFQPGQEHPASRDGPPPIAARQTAPFGEPRAVPRRGKANGALRSTRRRASTEQGTRALRSPGPPLHGKGNQRPLGVEGSSPAGQGHPASRSQARGALRSTARQASPAQGHPRSSEQGRLGTVRGSPTATPDDPPLGAGRLGKPRQGFQVYVTRLGVWRSARTPTSVGTHAGQDGNGRKATAAVMRYGCWRGEVFEGCELRRGECPRRAAPPSGGAERRQA